MWFSKTRDFQKHVILKTRDSQKHGTFKNTWFSKTRDSQKHVIFNGSYKTKEKGWANPLPLNMGLYFLDNGSLIINKLLLFKSLIGKRNICSFGWTESFTG